MLTKLTNYLLSNHIEYSIDTKRREIKISSDILLSQAEVIMAYCGEPKQLTKDCFVYDLNPIIFEI